MMYKRETIRFFLTCIVLPSYVSGFSTPLQTQKLSPIAQETNTRGLYSNDHLTIFSRMSGRSLSPFEFQMSGDNNEYEDDELSEMKNDIEKMRKEASERIDALSNQILDTTSIDTSALKSTASSQSNVSASGSSVAISNALSSKPSIRKTDLIGKNDVDLLDGTHWKVMLNIGREQGTWMPKTWGVSGDRLRATFEINFTQNQLYEREEFLGGIGGSKQIEILNKCVTMSPSLSEGSRDIPIKKGSGGWRVSKGDGPLGTDLLRFYIDLEQEMSHSGSDVYCPKGRVYMQCGFFSLNNNNIQFGGRREELKKELDEVTRKYEDLTQQIEEEGFFSLRKMKLTRDIVQVSMDARMVNAKLNDARVIEPDKSLLRMSQDGNVGLTKEGGVVCKVMKGAVREYHILGKFALASVEPRQEIDKDKDEKDQLRKRREIIDSAN